MSQLLNSLAIAKYALEAQIELMRAKRKKVEADLYNLDADLDELELKLTAIDNRLDPIKWPIIERTK